jgi:predicted enzyme related to lactoylglutathione lyase
MGARTSYSPGTFSWAELATSDAAAAKAFYTALFAWEYDDMPVGDGQVYTMSKRDGQVVGALFSSEEPPHWNCYVTVASVDDAAARAAELGATVVSEPFDVMDAGRMAVIADPGGATLCLWEPRGSIGATLVNAPGAMTWNDLVTPDPDAAARFYGDLFG